MKDPKDLTVGKRLQQAREQKGLAIEAVAKVTRISARNLEALEGDDFAALPAPIFVRSFLKTYATMLGIDANKIIALYEAQSGMMGASAATPPPPEKEFSRRILLVVIPILVVLVVGGIYLFSSSPRKAPVVAPPASPPETAPAAPQIAPPPEPPPPVKEVQKPSAEVQKPSAKEPPAKKVEQKPEQRVLSPAPQQPQQPPAAPSVATPEKQERRHVLRVQAREQTWFKVQADDQPEFEVLLEPGEKAAWTARRQIKIILGNAGGVDMTFNGKKVGPFGETGQVAHLQFPLPEKKSGE